MRTLTVTTNAAGHAAVIGLTPTTAGAVQIQVSAAFQGQTATAVIEQTIVATAAQAAALGGAAAGGGLSTGAILEIVGGVAAVAGGVVVAGAVVFTYSTGPQGVSRMIVTYEGRALFDTGCTGAAATGTQSLSYAGRDTAVTVQVMPHCSGGSRSGWEYRLSCPR